ncbi:hypothetical protein O7635_07615 [Asanoa sp. WMMD1127]|uniref:hypothetical protein n=1 Tax=Asanoa sp. WMMD1127 TaxID=3016107 RepID=UPI002417C207|nr:hypothetical protein [Asanoa sp. WMMD1127]MDG4821719.1 hypothetical protein [Asanoa sp. WMMD1127]
MRVYGAAGSALEDLDFLRWFPSLTRLSIDLPGLGDLGFLEKFSGNLEYLNIDRTVTRIDLARIPARGLRGLRLVNHERGLQSLLQANQSLRSLALWKYRAALALTLGSVRDRSALGDFERLRLLVLRGVRGFEELDFLPRLKVLEWLWVETVKLHTLPSLRKHRSLVRVDLDGIRTLRPDMIVAVSEAPNLTELVVNGGRLTPADFGILTGHPTLLATRISLGSLRRNDELARLLPNQQQPRTHSDFARSSGIELAI